MNWIYTIKAGAELRDKIGNSDVLKEQADIIVGIRKCCKEVMNRFKDDEDILFDFEELYELMDGEAEIILNGEWEEIGFDNAEDLINERLRELYDICDDNAIFVGL